MELTEHRPDPFADLMAEPAAVAPGQAMWLRYNYGSGQARTGTLTPEGVAIMLRDFPLDPQWFQLVALGNGRVAFLNNVTRMLTVGDVGLDGTFADVANNQQVDLAHQLVAVHDDMLLSYLVRATAGGYRGTAVTGRVAANGTYTRLSEPLLFDFWTHIVPVNDGLVLFFNTYSRLAATGRVTGDGGFADVGTFPDFDAWTHIHAASDGTLLFYNINTGAAASGRVRPDGTFVNLHSAFLGTGVSFLPTRDGRMVVFRQSDTLVAGFGGINGWFFDARTVNGLITPRPELFVR